MPTRRRSSRSCLTIVVIVVALVGLRFGIRSLTASDTLPNLVGMNLKDAEHTADAAGFSSIKTHDASGGDRSVLFDSHWQVCFQSPSPGSGDTGATVNLGVMKDGACPAIDEGTATPTVGSTMPDFVGDSLAGAIAALPSSIPIKEIDATGRSRAIILNTHWKVCTQTPATGVRLAGQSVTFKVVKLGETCPA